MYRYSAGDQAHILFSVGIKDASELSSLMQRLNDKDMPTQDLSGIEAAQVSHDGKQFTAHTAYSCGRHSSCDESQLPLYGGCNVAYGNISC
jgi:hypothetical protein